MDIHMGIQWIFTVKKQNVLDGHSMDIQINRFFFLSFDV